MSSDIAIRVENLSKRYEIYEAPRDRLKQFVLPRLQRLANRHPRQYFKEFWALKDVSFEVKKGETVGIIGRNGSGKSTLLQMICGTLNPTSGSITTHGRIAALLELGSGFNPEFSGRENVYMNAAVLGLSKEEVDQRFDDIAAFADIGEFIEQPVKTYSSGMMIRLAFAVAINVAPDVLIIDEALAVGDELFQRKCFSKIESIKKSGATILFVSHSGQQIVELCDRALLIDLGENIADGAPRKTVALYQKLLYSDGKDSASIKDEIRKSFADRSNFKAAQLPALVGMLENHEVAQDDAFDKNLKSLSLIKYEARGGEIEAIKICTLDGRQVNTLRRGETYKYSYCARFFEASERVRFAMAIRTTSGLFLGGSYSSSDSAKSISSVEAGRVIQVGFTFKCILNPGVYFMNAAAFRWLGDEEVVMSRIVDALAFRVLPVPEDIATGYLWFAPAPVLSEE